MDYARAYNRGNPCSRRSGLLKKVSVMTQPILTPNQPPSQDSIQPNASHRVPRKGWTPPPSHVDPGGNRDPKEIAKETPPEK